MNGERAKGIIQIEVTVKVSKNQGNKVKEKKGLGLRG